MSSSTIQGYAGRLVVRGRRCSSPLSRTRKSAPSIRGNAGDPEDAGVDDGAIERRVEACVHHELRGQNAPIGVSVLCPAFVDTGISNSERNRPAELADSNPEAEQYSDRIRQAIKSGKLSAADIASIWLWTVLFISAPPTLTARVSKLCRYCDNHSLLFYVVRESFNAQIYCLPSIRDRRYEQRSFIPSVGRKIRRPKFVLCRSHGETH